MPSVLAKTFSQYRYTYGLDGYLPLCAPCAAFQDQFVCTRTVPPAHHCRCVDLLPLPTGQLWDLADLPLNLPGFFWIGLHGSRFFLPYPLPTARDFFFRHTTAAHRGRSWDSSCSSGSNALVPFCPPHGWITATTCAGQALLLVLALLYSLCLSAAAACTALHRSHRRSSSPFGGLLTHYTYVFLRLLSPTCTVSTFVCPSCISTGYHMHVF